MGHGAGGRSRALESSAFFILGTEAKELERWAAWGQRP